jgi:hypothetical protein
VVQFVRTLMDLGHLALRGFRVGLSTGQPKGVGRGLALLTTTSTWTRRGTPRGVRRLVGHDGAAAANLEFLGPFLFPLRFATGAMGNLMEAGGRLVNGTGDTVQLRPRPPAARTSRTSTPGPGRAWRYTCALVIRAAVEV